MKSPDCILLQLGKFCEIRNCLSGFFTIVLLSVPITLVPIHQSNAASDSDQSSYIDPTDQLSRLTEVQSLWEKAISAWENDDTDTAVELLTKAIELSPDDANLLDWRASIYLETDKYRDAIKDLKAAAEMLPGSSTAHGNLGWALILEGSFLESRQASLAAHRLDPIEWVWLFNLAHSYLLLGDVVAAQQYFERALPLIPALSEIESLPWTDFEIFANRGWSVEAVTKIGEWVKSEYSEFSDHRSAIALMYGTVEQQSNYQYEDALDTSRRARNKLQTLFDPDHLIMAWAHYYVGSSHHLLGNYKEAEKHYLKALAIPKRILGEDSPYTADFVNDLAGLYWSLGEYARAEILVKKSLRIAEEALGADHGLTGNMRSTLGGLYTDMGRYSQAETLLLKSLALSEKTFGPSSDAVANELASLAYLYHIKGAYADAENTYLRALDIVRQLNGPDSLDFSTTETSLAILYQDLGDYERAQRIFEHDLKITQDTLGNDHLHTAIAIHNLASLLHDKHEFAEAETLYKKGISIAEKVLGPSHPSMSVDYHNLAKLYADIGNYKQALKYFEKAFSISQSSLGTDHPSTVTTILDFAGILHEQGQSSRAQSLYALIPPVSAPGRSLEELAYLQYGWAAYFSREGELATAIFFGKQAINTLQEVRGTLTKLEKKLQQYFVSSRSFFYRDLANWLIDSGRLPEAQQVLAMLKEDEFFQYIQRTAPEDARKTQAAYNALETAWAARYQEIEERLVSISIDYQKLKEQKALGLTPSQESRYTELEADIRVGRLAFMSFQEDIRKDYFAQGIERAVELAKKDIDLDSQDRISGFLESLEVDAALLTYLVGENSLRILLTLPSAPPIAREANISASDLRHQVYAFRTLLQNPDSDPMSAAEELYRSLIAPVEADLLQADTQMLMLQLDDVLRYVPFGALHDGDTYLIQRYALSIYTPAARRLTQTKQPKNWRIAGLGFAKGTQDFLALPYVFEELNAIVKESDKHDPVGVIEGIVRVDDDFTSNTLSDILLADEYNILHIATHFVFRPGTINESYMVLGNGEQLSLNDLRLGNYPFFGLDLITLSACETAMGGRNSDGREVEGFGTLAQNRGAASVIAALWPVADVSTAYLMVRFYSLWENEGRTKAEALRQAQLDFLDVRLDESEERLDFSDVGLGDIGEQVSDYTELLPHPYFWAPFILMGDWL